MGGPSVPLALIILMLVSKLVPLEFADHHAMDKEMRLTIESLCPRVDICLQNSSEAMIKPNGMLGSSGLMSCCIGCSCHKDCHKELNCCFPDDMITGDVNNETSVSTGRDVLATEHMSMGETAYMSQCVFARSGTPTEDWNVYEPAYPMVVNAPQGGCISTPTEPTVHKEYNIPATCDIKPLTPWGDLLPVYSNTNNTIYKNSLCAECHGVYDYQAWTTLLVCDTYDQNADIYISLTEHIDFVLSGNMSKYCHVSFQYKESLEPIKQRCFVDPIKTCSDGFRVPDETGLTSSEIKEACRSGLRAPVQFKNLVYKNAFCVLCNNGILTPCYPRHHGTDKSFMNNIVILLDTSFIVNENKARKEGRKVSHPKACLLDGAKLDQDNCRAVYCPSGQIRKNNGQCEVFVKDWTPRKFVLKVRLEYVNRNKMSILNMLNEGLVSRAIITETFVKSNPWPVNFEITALYMENTSADSNPAVAVVFEIITGRFETLLSIVRKLMERRWTVVISGNRIAFQQSLMVIPLKQMDALYGPNWKRLLSNLDKRVDISNLATNWTIIFKNTKPLSLPYIIPKVTMCNLITLYEDEYELMADKTLLVSNLTNDVLIAGEYETLKDEHGNVNARVCIQYTGFELKSVTNYAFKKRASNLQLITVVFPIIATCIYL